MTPRRTVASGPVPRESLDIATRDRIVANLRRFKHESKFPSDAAMARVLGITRQAMTRYLTGKRTVGLDFVLLCHRKLHVSIDWLVDRPPPQEWFDPEYDPDAPSHGKR